MANPVTPNAFDVRLSQVVKHAHIEGELHLSFGVPPRFLNVNPAGEVASPDAKLATRSLEPQVSYCRGDARLHHALVDGLHGLLITSHRRSKLPSQECPLPPDLSAAIRSTSWPRLQWRHGARGSCVVGQRLRRPFALQVPPSPWWRTSTSRFEDTRALGHSGESQHPMTGNGLRRTTLPPGGQSSRDACRPLQSQPACRLYRQR